ncbi:MAG: NAD(P)/FAD-dependent oxidoreductase [Bacteroidota bacterium]|nr:NAD(P)/FAD-dependent oxidoreductase [Bacteroidota bacterium]
MSKRIVIIGGGIAGLSAGIYSQRNGFDTEIIEMNNLPGGQCTAWDRKGYRFDHCLHWLVGTARGPYHQIWKETNVINDGVKIIDQEIHTKVVDENGDEFIIYTNIDRWKNYLLEMAPEDSISINRMCNEMKKISILETSSNPPGMRSWVDSLNMYIKIMPVIPLFLRYKTKTVHDYIEILNFKNRRLIYFLDALYGQSDFSVIAFLMMLSWFDQNNAGYLVGGSLPLTIRMSEKYKALGGKLSLVNKADKIIVSNDKATGIILSNGTRIDADYVISAADGYTTIFKMLDGKYQTEQIKEAYTSWPLFTPFVQVSFGINKKIKSTVANQLFLAKGMSIGRTSLEKGYTLMNYSFDTTMAPREKTVIILRFESPWELWKDLSGEEYLTEKKQIEKDAVAILKKQFPEVDQYLEVIDIATPKTGVRYTGVWKGSYEGFLPTNQNLTKNIGMTLPKLNNFYMCGQWLSPGGGIPPAAQSGKWAIQLICKKEQMKFTAE